MHIQQIFVNGRDQVAVEAAGRIAARLPAASQEGAHNAGKIIKCVVMSVQLGTRNLCGLDLKFSAYRRLVRGRLPSLFTIS